MAIEVCSDKVECKVSAKRMWRAAFEDAHNCLPKAVPHVIAGVEYEGSGFQPGSVRTIHFNKSKGRFRRARRQERMLSTAAGSSLHMKRRQELLSDKKMEITSAKAEVAGGSGELPRGGGSPKTCWARRKVFFSMTNQAAARKHATACRRVV